jgi:hypothetical protein
LFYQYCRAFICKARNVPAAYASNENPSILESWVVGNIRIFHCEDGYVRKLNVCSVAAIEFRELATELDLACR